MDEVQIQRVDYRHAPMKIRVGWVIMLIGTILFFIGSVVDWVTFGITIGQSEIQSDTNTLLEVIRLPFVSIVLLFGGFGGLCYLFDRKKRLKSIGTLAAVVVLVFFVIDTVLVIRSLIHDLAGRTVNPYTGEHYSAGESWLRFLISLLDLQLTGGVYLIGWAIIKDYLGDDYEQQTKKK